MGKITYALKNQKTMTSITYSVEVMEEGVLVQSIPTVFEQECHAQQLVNLCNEYDVDPAHVLNIMDDMIYEIQASKIRV